MLGPLVNALVIAVCAFAGCFLIRGIPARVEEILKKAIGLSVIYVGIRGTLENQNVLLLIMSLVIGAVLGELINIDKYMNRLGNWAEKKLVPGTKEGVPNEESPGSSETGPGSKAATGRSFSRAFVSASILFCTGSMAIVGSMQSGLTGNHEMLFAKSVLDGSISLVFGASLGPGVAFSAIPVLAYQGAIALASIAARDFLNPEIIREMSAAGSILVAAIGFNFLGLKEDIRVANLIPAVFIPWIYLGLRSLI